MKMLKKTCIGSAFILLAIMILAACSNESSSSSDSSNEGSTESGDVQKIKFVAAQYSNETQPFLENIVEEFEDENPDIEVELQVIGWDSLEQQVTTMVTTDQAPDIVNLSRYADYAADDLLMPLEDILSDELQDKLYDSFYDAGKLDGSHYGLPLLATIRGLYYNEDIFEEAGITSPPETWDEIVETAKTIKEKTGIDGFGVPMTSLEGQAYISYFIWGNDGNWKEDDEWVLNSSENVEAIEFMDSLVNEHKVTNPEPTAINRDELQKVFGAGQLGMMISANFLPTILKEDAPDLNYGVSTIPLNEGVDPFNLGVQDFLMVFKSTEHPEAVSKFFDFFYEDERYEEFMKNEGMLPVTETVGDIMSEEDPEIAQFIEQLPIAKFYPLSDGNFGEARIDTINAVQEVLLGEKTAKESLDDLQELVESY